MMDKFCCISVTLAARLIGAFDLSTSILAVNFIAREFFTDEQRLIAFEEIQIFLGLSWAKSTSLDLQRRLDHKWILVCLMVYSIIHLICSSVLILATIFRKKTYATPWLTFEIISLASQASGIAVHIFQYQCAADETAIAEPAYVPMASLYFFLGTYFWLLVFAAQRSWPAKEASPEADDSLILEKSHVLHLNSPKTPSSRVLLENRSIFESPEPPISAKYYQL